jgi:hypothetical protein
MDERIDHICELVAKAYNEKMRRFEWAHKATPDEVKLVWYNKCCKQYKAIAIILGYDNAVYEVTHNVERHETYVDRYTKESKYTETEDYIGE